MQRPRLVLSKYQVRPGHITAYGAGNFGGFSLWGQRGEELCLVVIPKALYRRLKVFVDPLARHEQDRQAGQNPLSRIRVVACDAKGSAPAAGRKERAKLRITRVKRILTGAKPGGGRGRPVDCGILPTGKGSRSTG